ncbi:MAG TPA: hypothetical protein VLH38_04130 [Patescibacteria group bacterium]|nr:hypothetical protein [Patescibacteria group bacterium]
MSRRIFKITPVILFALACALFIAKPVSALSNLGPDPADFIPQVASDTFAYAVSSADHEYAAIPQTRVFLYFKNNVGNKTVTIIGGDVCTDRQDSALNGTGGNYWDRPYKPNPPAQPAVPPANWPYFNSVITRYSVTSGQFVYGVFSNSDNCYRNERNITIPGAALTFDQNTGFYKTAFTAAMVPGYSNAQNHFQLRLSDADALVGYDAALPEDSTGLLRYNRDPAQTTNGYSDYLLRFAPSCSVKTPAAASGYWYDDDNDSPSTQPERLWLQLLKYRTDTGAYAGAVPLQFVGAQSVTAGPVGTSYYVNSGNKKDVRMDFTVEPGYKYIWRWNHVFHRNVIQFRLPYDSVYYVTGCQAPAATVSPKTVVDKTTVSYPDAATFTHSVALSSGSLIGAKLNYSIRRYRNGAPIGAPQTGVYSYTPGVYVVKTNQYNAVPADAGATICENLTLSNVPGGNITITGNPSQACTLMANQPYLKVFGGDVSVGGGIADTAGNCGYNPDGGLVSWNLGSGSGYKGGGAQYAAYAIGQITDFATAQTTSGSGPPSSLAFTSVGMPAGAVFGGNASSAACVPSYYAMPSAAESTYLAGGSVTGLASGKYRLYGTPSLEGGVVNPGTRLKLYVDGDVYIKHNITYGEPWSVDQTPLFELIVNGTVFVDSHVDRLDGVYIALPRPDDPATGTIYTCTTAAMPYFNNNSVTALLNTCSTKLTVNGSFVANHVKTLRSGGTVGLSITDDAATGASSAAEQVNYGPAFWIPQPGGLPTPGKFDAISTLPPIL